MRRSACVLRGSARPLSIPSVTTHAHAHTHTHTHTHTGHIGTGTLVRDAESSAPSGCVLGMIGISLDGMAVGQHTGGGRSIKPVKLRLPSPFPRVPLAPVASLARSTFTRAPPPPRTRGTHTRTRNRQQFELQAAEGRVSGAVPEAQVYGWLQPQEGVGSSCCFGGKPAPLCCRFAVGRRCYTPPPPRRRTRTRALPHAGGHAGDAESNAR